MVCCGSVWIGDVLFLVLFLNFKCRHRRGVEGASGVARALAHFTPREPRTPASRFAFDRSTGSGLRLNGGAVRGEPVEPHFYRPCQPERSSAIEDCELCFIEKSREGDDPE